MTQEETAQTETPPAEEEAAKAETPPAEEEKAEEETPPEPEPDAPEPEQKIQRFPPDLIPGTNEPVPRE